MPSPIRRLGSEEATAEVMEVLLSEKATPWSILVRIQAKKLWDSP